MIPRNDGAGFSLVSVVFSILLLSTIGLTLSPLLSNRAFSSVHDLQAQQAFHVADGGLQYILQKDFENDLNFSDNTSPTGAPFGGTPITLGQGQFWIEYFNLGVDEGDIRSTAKVANSIRQVQLHIEKVPFTPFAAFSGGNTELQETGAASGLINGDVAYVGSYVNPGDRFDVTGTVEPSSSSPGSVNLAPLIALTTQTITGDRVISGNECAGGCYWHVTGNVTLANDSGTITGIIVADGNITMSLTGTNSKTVNGTLAADGNIIASLGAGTSTFIVEAQMAGGQMQPALAADGNVELSNEAGSAATIIRGLVQTNRNVIINAVGTHSTTVEGVIHAQGNIDLNATGNSALVVDLDAGADFLDTRLEMTDWKEV